MGQDHHVGLLARLQTAQPRPAQAGGAGAGGGIQRLARADGTARRPVLGEKTLHDMQHAVAWPRAHVGAQRPGDAVPAHGLQRHAATAQRLVARRTMGDPAAPRRQHPPGRLPQVDAVGDDAAGREQAGLVIDIGIVARRGKARRRRPHLGRRLGQVGLNETAMAGGHLAEGAHQFHAARRRETRCHGEVIGAKGGEQGRAQIRGRGALQFPRQAVVARRRIVQGHVHPGGTDDPVATAFLGGNARRAAVGAGPGHAGGGAGAQGVAKETACLSTGVRRVGEARLFRPHMAGQPVEQVFVETPANGMLYPVGVDVDETRQQEAVAVHHGALRYPAKPAHGTRFADEAILDKQAAIGDELPVVAAQWIEQRAAQEYRLASHAAFAPLRPRPRWSLSVHDKIACRAPHSTPSPRRFNLE